MNKEIAQKLEQKAGEIAEAFSNTDREYNHANERFEVEKIIPASEKTAFVVFRKEPSKKYGLAFLYYLKDPKNGYWQYFFPSESHLYGMLKLKAMMQVVEEYNYPKNF